MGDNLTWEAIRDVARSLPKVGPNAVRLSRRKAMAVRLMLPEVIEIGRRVGASEALIGGLSGFRIEVDESLSDDVAVFGWRLPNGAWETDKIVVLTA
jgi:hypothetical protein